MEPALDLLPLISTLGTPGAILIVLFVAGRWTATNVVKPLVDRHIRFVDSIEESANTQAGNIKALCEAQQEQGKNVETLIAHLCNGKGEAS